MLCFLFFLNLLMCIMAQKVVYLCDCSMYIPCIYINVYSAVVG